MASSRVSAAALWLPSRPKCPPHTLTERVLLPPQLCSDCGQWSMVGSPFVSPTQSKQFETCELLQPQNFTLVPLSELLCPPPTHPKEKGLLETMEQEKHPVAATGLFTGSHMDSAQTLATRGKHMASLFLASPPPPQIRR